MDRYENLGLVGEGSYGMVLKCRHKDSNQIVAIKKFIESEDDKMVKKIAMREIKMLKQLRHENLVNLLEVFRRKKRLYLVFEFVDRTVLDDLEAQPNGLNDRNVKRISFQVLRGLEFCHSHNIIHRDVKPENILISKSGIVKLCDFGFARTLATGPGEVFTDYVATRWYRAPELLVGDLNYGKAVDVWAVGCLLFEMITADPLFPGDSDIDQLFHIIKTLGNLTQRHLEIFHKNPLFTGMRLPTVKNPEPFTRKYPRINKNASDLIIKSLHLEASYRPSCLQMMKHGFFAEGDFAVNFIETLKQTIEKETTTNPLLKSLAARKDKANELNEKITNEISTKLSETKRKKEVKNIEKCDSVSTLPHCPSLGSKKFSNSPHNRRNSKDDNNVSPIHYDRRRNDETSCDNRVDNQGENRTFKDDNINNNTDNDTNNNSKKDMDAFKSTVMSSSSKSFEHERADAKVSQRTPMDVSVNTLGKNLPTINQSMNATRAHGYDVIKQKKVHAKKSHSKHMLINDGLYAVAEKVPLHIDRCKSIDEFSLNGKLKRKESKRDIPEGGLTKRSGLHLPSVKGLDANGVKGSPSRGNIRKPHLSTIPHIQNLDPFSSTNQHESEPQVGNSRFYRDGNLPAV